MAKRVLSLLLAFAMLGIMLAACSAPEAPAVPENTDELVIFDDTDTNTGTDTEAKGITESGEYSKPEQVAEYIHTYGHLPSNYITKGAAEDLGWDNRAGNLWDVAPGKSIGGNRFGNYEGLLPKGNYKECDVNYYGGYRGDERLIYDNKGNIYYTDDHYETFTKLY